MVCRTTYITALRCVAHLVVISVSCSVLWTCFEANNVHTEVKNDANQYVRMAFNLHHDGVYSKRCWDPREICTRDKLIPTFYRGPGYSAILALAMKLDPVTRKMSRSEFWREPLRINPRVHPTLRTANWVIMVVTALLCMGITWKLTGSVWLGYLSLLLVGTSPMFAYTIRYFLSERAAAMFLAAFVLALIYALESERRIHFTLAGVTLALLALTKSVFAYSWPLLLAILALACYWQPGSRRRILSGAACLLAGYFVLVGPWMARNYAHFGTWAVSRRGGEMLQLRVQFNKMTKEEYLASFLLWTPSRAAERLLKEHFKPTVRDRFSRRNPEGFIKMGKASWGGPHRKHGRIQGAEVLKEMAVREILSHPVKHLAVSLSLANRLMYMERDKPLFGMTIPESVLCPILFASLLVVAAIGLIRKETRLLALWLPVLYAIAFHALFSNCRTRYAEPLIPLLYVCVVVFVHCCFLLARCAVRRVGLLRNTKC